MSIHFGEDKTKSILFSTKNRKRKIGTLGMQYSGVKSKQYSKITYLGCRLDESLSGKVMALKVINKIKGRLKFFYKKNRYLTPYLKWPLCNALIQSHFDYACSAWHPILIRNSKANSKLSKTHVLDPVPSWITEITLEWTTLKKITDSQFLKDLIGTFVLTLLNFLRKLVLYIFIIYMAKIKQIRDLLFWN